MAAVHEKSWLGRWLSAPVFPSEELTERARILHRAAWTSFFAATIAFSAIALAQPADAARPLTALLLVDLLVLVVLEISRRGHPQRAGVLAIATLLAIVTALAPSGGGIRSPGATMYFAFVLIAGVLLGPRAAMRTAIVCALLATGLVVAELGGLIHPGEGPYGPVGLLFMNFLYITVIVALTRVASKSMSDALTRAESELAERREAESHLAMALDAGGIGVWEHLKGSDRFHFDERTCAIFGLPPSEDGMIALADVHARIHPKDQGVVGRMSGLAEGQTASLEHRVVHPDGSVRHLAVSGRFVRSAPGEPGRVVGMVTDVTVERQARLDRERLLGDLRERMKELTLLHDVARLLHGRWYFDRSVLAEIVEMMPSAWQFPQHCEARLRYRDETYATAGWRETPWMQSRAFETSTGSGVVEVAYTREFPVADEGPFVNEERELLDSLAEMLVGHLESEHIEEVRRDLEGQLRQSQKMEALGTLAGGIAHDFNNILTAIGGNVDLALLDARDEGMRGYLLEVKGAHERARDLVKRILVFGRRQEAQKKVVALEPIVAEALNLMRVSVGQGIRIETHFVEGLPPVLADSTQIHQVLMNLATNAAYAMREGGGTLTIGIDERTTRNPLEDRMPAELHPGRYVRLSMRDTGTGMSAEVRERLFEPFYTTKGVLGTGLGLSVVHGIVHDHGGGICVESEPGAGTLFELYFPAAAALPEAAVPAEAAPRRGRGQRILCVDDEEAVLFVMTRTLERMGYRTTGCPTPGEALETFRERPDAFDAVITDMGMPGMSGLDLAVALHDIRPDIPIAIASGYARPHNTPADVAAWIHKPPSREELAGALDDILASQPEPR